jgi:hypothetical protein
LSLKLELEHAVLSHELVWVGFCEIVLQRMKLFLDGFLLVVLAKQLLLGGVLAQVGQEGIT